MADSDNSMSAFFVTRRRLLAGTATVAAAWPFHGKSRAAELTVPPSNAIAVFLSMRTSYRIL